jgi:hypothetical protein
MHTVTIRAALPFPLRVNDAPYEVETFGAKWTITVNRVAQSTPDDRIAGKDSTNFDLQVDRFGAVAYSNVVGVASLLTVDQEVVGSFVSALNILIAYARDLFNFYWVREVEVSDLYKLSVQVDNQLTEYFSAGRGGGFTLAVVGLRDEANAALEAALSSGKSPPVWRQMLLDARDALETGRNEDCGVLAWSSLESACRQSLPGLSHRAGLSPLDLMMKLDPTGRWAKGRRGWRQRPPYAHEDSVSRISDGLQIVELTAELTDPPIYHAESVVESVRTAIRLRNRIVHQGARVRHDDALGALESVEFVLGQALSLRDVDPPPPLASWKKRFGHVRRNVAEFASRHSLRLIVSYPEESFFEIEYIGDELWVRFADDLSARSSAILMLTQWDAWLRRGWRNRPHLRIHREFPNPFWLSGLTDMQVRAVEDSVCFAEALIGLHSNSGVETTAKYAASHIVRRLKSVPPFDLNDIRIATASAQLAKYLAVLSPSSRSARLRSLCPSQPEIARNALNWSESMAALDPDDEHGRCTTLRRIHDDSFWMDTIEVICPVERIAFGSGRRPLNEL